MKDVVFPLLESLAAAGNAERAAELRQRFAEQGWNTIDAGLLAELLEDVRAATVRRAESPTVWPSRLPNALQHFAPFVAAIAEGEKLLGAIDRLTRCERWAETADSARGLFCQLLGYTAVALDESARVSTRPALESLEIMGTHRGFDVCLVRRSGSWKYDTELRHVFRLHPHAIALVLDPEERRGAVAYRRAAGSRQGEIRTRPLFGRGHLECPEEDLLVWARRFEQLRPRPEDDRSALSRRAQAALEMTAAQVGSGWASAPLTNADAESGAPWEHAPAVETNSFLQLGSARGNRSFWGVEAALRDAFPIITDEGARRLEYVDYELRLPDRDAWHAVTNARTHAALGVLTLCVVDVGSGERADAEVPVSVPVPDEHGRFVLDGDVFEFAPRVGADGSLAFAALPGVVDDELLEQFLEIEDNQGATDGADAELPETPSLVDHESRGGASLVTLLAWCVGVRLRRIAGRLAMSACTTIRSAGSIRGVLATLFDREQRLVLVETTLLRSALQRLEHPYEQDRPRSPLRQRLEDGDGTPPAWSCLVAAANEPPGNWRPVAAARLAPGGGLAVPLVAEDGTRRLVVSDRSALDVASTYSDAESPGPEGRVAFQFRSLGICSAPPVGVPTEVASLATSLSGAVIVRGPGRELCAVVPPGWSRARVRRVGLVQDIPIVRSEPKPPTLLLGPAARVRSGDTWLAVPEETWPGPKRYGAHLIAVGIRSGLSKELGLPGVKHVEMRVPPGLSGVVEQCAIVEVRTRRGVQTGWRATMTLVQRFEGLGSVLLQDGRRAPIVDRVPLADLPFDADGTTAEVLILDPAFDPAASATSTWRDAATGEPGSHERYELAAWWLPPELPHEIVGPDPHLSRRLIDGEAAPAWRESPALTSEEVMLWRAMNPSLASHALDPSFGRGERTNPVWWRTVECLLAAGAVPEQLRGVIASEVRRERHSEGAWDPPASNLRAVSSAEPRWSVTEWSCDCRELTGADRAPERCAACGTEVSLRSSRGELKLPYFRMPTRLLHPWRLPLAAAVLGLLPAELRGLLVEHSIDAIAPFIDEALSSPRSRIERRFERETEQATKVAVGAQIVELDAAGDNEGFAALIWMTGVPMLPGFLRAQGYPANSPRLLSSALQQRLRMVRFAADTYKRARSSASQAVRAESAVQLQRAVTAIYGDPHDEAAARDPACVAAVVRTLWPLSRDAHTRTASPTLAWMCGSGLRAPAEQGDGSAEGGHEPVGRVRVLAPACDRALRLVPRGASGVETVRDLADWRRRWTSARFRREDLAFLCATLDLALERAGSTVGTDDLPLRQPTSSAPLVAACAGAALDPRSDPGDLRNALHGALPRRLPDAPDLATEAVLHILRTALPGDGADLQVARNLLARLYASWFQVPCSTSHPVGWSFAPGQTGGDGRRRAIPPMRTVAWRELKLLDPYQPFFDTRASHRRLHPSTLRLVGLAGCDDRADSTSAEVLTERDPASHEGAGNGLSVEALAERDRQELPSHVATPPEPPREQPVPAAKEPAEATTDTSPSSTPALATPSADVPAAEVLVFRGSLSEWLDG